MFKLLQVILVIMAIVAADASIGFGLQYKGNGKHPDLPNHCYLPEHNLTLALNETLYPTNLEKSCIRVLCRDDYVLEIRHCDRPTLEKCTVSEYDYTKPYPACCPLVTCNGQVFRSPDN